MVAALAGGFTLARLCWPTLGKFSPHAVREWCSAAFGATMIPCTVAAVVIRLMRPRPRAQRLLCQPGMAACCAATVAIVAGLCRPVLAALERKQFSYRNLARDRQRVLGGDARTLDRLGPWATLACGAALARPSGPRAWWAVDRVRISRVCFFAALARILAVGRRSRCHGSFLVYARRVPRVHRACAKSMGRMSLAGMLARLGISARSFDRRAGVFSRISSRRLRSGGLSARERPSRSADWHGDISLRRR